MARTATRPAERRTRRAANMQIRLAGDTSASFVGYASTTGVPYSVRDWLGEYEETILPRAFAKSLRERDAIPLLHNHDPQYVLANTSSGTSRLSEDGTGLRNEADLDRRQSFTNDLCISLERGDVGAMSFAFSATKESWNAKYTVRKVAELKLFDTSIVTHPANPATTAGLRDAMRAALGREGRSILLADHEPSVRSVLPAIRRGGAPAGVDRDALFERAFRALNHADEELAGRYEQARARTAVVADSLLQLRAGRVLSAANEQLLSTALTALSDAGAHHDTAHQAISTVLTYASGDGQDFNQGAGTGESTIAPLDGAGPRSKALRLNRQREAELRKLGVRRAARARSEQLRREREIELKQLRRGA